MSRENRYLFPGLVWLCRMLVRRWKTVVGIALVLAVAYALSGSILAYKVSQELARIRAEGGPVEMTDRFGPPIPDSENAALIYQQVFERIKPIENSRLFNEYYYHSQGSPSAIPRPGSHTESWWKDVYGLFKKCDNSYFPKVLRAEAMPECRFDVNYTYGKESDITGLDLRYVGRLWSLSNVLCLRSLAMARQGKSEEAVDSLITEVRLQRALAHGETMLHTMTGYAIISRSAKTAAEVAQRCRLSDAQSTALDQAFADLDLQSSLVSGLEGERAFFIWMYRASRSNPAVLKSLGPEDMSSPPVSLRIKLLFYADLLAYLRQAREGIGTASLPYREALRATERGRERWRKLPRFWLSSWVGAVGVSMTKHRDTTMARLSGTRILLALHQYKQHHGEFPNSLSAMESAMKWTPPLDPFSGKPFIYNRQGSGFILYSIGDDLKDDGGVPQSSKPVARYEGDIVWRE